LAGAGNLGALPGPTGVEGMPLWMMSPQTDDPASVIGYVPAIEVAYLQPGTGAALLSQFDTTLIAGTANVEDSFLAGRLVPLDRYLLTTITASGSSSAFFEFPHV
jgi:hypothetical protein